MQLPQGQQPMNGTSTNSMPSTPLGHQTAPPPAAPGAMGPPSAPPSRPVDAADLTDVLTGAGIDVREEEAFLTRSFSGPNAQAQAPQRVQPPALNTSFASQASTTGTISASSSFGDIKPAIPQESVSAPTPAPFKDPNEPTREDTQAARRAQYPLQECFLLTKALEQRIQKRGFELGVRIPSEGLFHPIPSRPSSISVMGPDGSSIVRTGQTILNQEGAPLVDILNLVSLSCEERLRGVIDYSAGLARSRRAHSHGVPPSEYQDMAQPLGPVAGATATPAKRMHQISRTNSMSHTNANDDEGPHSETEAVSSKPVTQRYVSVVRKDSAYENKRATKRTKRSANAILGEGAGAEAADSAPSTPMPERAPSFDRKTMSKKEAKKMMDTKASEAQQHQQSVETARLATNSMLSGRMFGSKKTYSWLKPGGATSGFSSPSRPNPPSTPTGGPKEASRSGEQTPASQTKRLGTWREDSEKGAGIQVRDILFMLEADGRATKHVQKGYSRTPREDRDRGV